MTNDFGVINLVVESEENSIPMAKRLIETTKNQLTDERIQKNLIALIESIIVYKFPFKAREEIEAMFNLSDLKRTRFYQDAFAEGEANIVLRLLNRRLGQIDPTFIEQIQRLSVEQLENLAEALLDFSSEEDLRRWLEENK